MTFTFLFSRQISRSLPITALVGLLAGPFAGCSGQEPQKVEKKTAAAQSKPEVQANPCEELIDGLCDELGSETCERVRPQITAFPPQQCEVMKRQFPQVVEELRRLEAANQPVSEEKQRLLAGGDGPAFGPEDAGVTLVAFSDFECPYCSRAAKALNRLKEQFGDHVRFVFRQFPLSFHKNAHLAAQAALAAHAQGKFWEFHDKLFENQRALTRPDLERYAKELGLDMTKFKAALDRAEYEQAVDDDIALGVKMQVGGTPTMFLNGRQVQNPSDANAIAARIEELLGQM